MDTDNDTGDTAFDLAQWQQAYEYLELMPIDD
jgi:hypothetical protein